MSPIAAASAQAAGPSAGSEEPQLRMYPGRSYQQPVPFDQLPAAAGVLPSWEQKKLELGMEDLSTSAGSKAGGGVPKRGGTGVVPSNGQPSNTNGSGSGTHSRNTSSASGSSSNNNNGSSGNKLSKPPPANGTDAVNRPGLFSSLRRKSSVSLGTKTQTNGGISTYSRGGIENNPHTRTGSATSSSAFSPSSPSSSSPSPPSSPRKPKRENSLLRYLQKTFSANRAGTTGGGYSSGNSKARGIGYTKPDAHTIGTSGDGAAGHGQGGKKRRNNAFAAKMRATSGKVTSRIQQQWTRFSSKTPKDQLPQNWDDWRKAYARGDIDVSDLPEPPARDANATDPSPQEAKFLPAPMPENQRERQLAFNRLDIEGKRGMKPSQIPVAEGEDPLPDTLETHPAFRNIVTQARALFDSSISILTVFNENRQLFLAETGLGGMKEVPREVTFCSHAVLQRPPQPFMLTDSHQDWRFAESPLVQGYGLRSYYGVPLLAPDFSGKADPIPIGTLCIIDDKPRQDFTEEQRSKMGDLALLAQKTIANWSRARLQARLDAMEASFVAWKNETNALTGTQRAAAITTRALPYNAIEPVADIEGSDTSGVESSRVSMKRQGSTISAKSGPAPSGPLPPVPSIPGHIAAPGSEDILHIRDPSTSGTPRAPPSLGRGDSDRSVSMVQSTAGESYYTAPQQPSNRQKIYDISTRLVASSLELSLVYVLRLDFSKPSPLSDAEETVKGLTLVSAYGLPTPEPAFDAVLHLKALRSEEGGLLYQNPNIDELVGGEKLPSNDDVEYASALLVPICESDKTGHVLAGFTDDPERVFERDDLLYLTTIASELAIYLTD